MEDNQHIWSELDAGEYVVGTLTGEELVLFKQALEYDAGLQRSVNEWQKILEPICRRCSDSYPLEKVWVKIRDRLS